MSDPYKRRSTKKRAEKTIFPRSGHLFKHSLSVLLRRNEKSRPILHFFFSLTRDEKKIELCWQLLFFSPTSTLLGKNPKEGLRSVLQLKKTFAFVIEIKWLVECWEQNISKRIVRLNVFNSMLTAVSVVGEFTSNYFHILGFHSRNFVSHCCW